MKEIKLKKRWRFISLLIAAFVLFVGLLSGLFFFNPTLRSRVEGEWETFLRKGGEILGWRKGGIPFEEKRIREEVILKKMEEANTHQDWRSLASEYPRLEKMESLPEEERRKALENSEEFKEVEKALKEYLKKREEELLNLEPPLPSLKEETNLVPSRDKAADKVIENLLSVKEKTSKEKPLEENLLLKIRGPLATREILERPSPPQVKLKMEGEIELTFWVLPDGMVDRVVPTMKGDTELERIAIQYLKQWRFAPLPKDKPQVEQWGIVPIKFKLQ
jgi:TonB family protein